MIKQTPCFSVYSCLFFLELDLSICCSTTSLYNLINSLLTSSRFNRSEEKLKFFFLNFWIKEKHSCLYGSLYRSGLEVGGRGLLIWLYFPLTVCVSTLLPVPYLRFSYFWMFCSFPSTSRNVFILYIWLRDPRIVSLKLTLNSESFFKIKPRNRDSNLIHFRRNVQFSVDGRTKKKFSCK